MLKINVGAVDLDKGILPSIPIPPIVLDAALVRFDEILDKLSHWHLRAPLHPIAIPDKPDSDYYKNFALAFARSYLTKNLLKCIITLEILRHHIDYSPKIYDLGGGSGAFSLALAAANKVDKIELIDSSSAQVELAKVIFEDMGYSQMASAKIQNMNSFSSDGKFCVSSYSFGEAMQSDINILNLIEKSEKFIIIDSPEIIKGLYSYLKFREISVFGRQVEFEAGECLSPFIEGAGGKFSFIFKGHSRDFI